ncbi:MAG: hypothetical protein ABII08_03020 [Candidatus Beckwithbacteria bacterium]
MSKEDQASLTLAKLGGVKGTRIINAGEFNEVGPDFNRKKAISDTIIDLTLGLRVLFQEDSENLKEENILGAVYNNIARLDVLQSKTSMEFVVGLIEEVEMPAIDQIASVMYFFMDEENRDSVISEMYEKGESSLVHNILFNWVQRSGDLDSKERLGLIKSIKPQLIKINPPFPFLDQKNVLSAFATTALEVIEDETEREVLIKEGLDGNSWPEVFDLVNQKELEQAFKDSEILKHIQAGAPHMSPEISEKVLGLSDKKWKQVVLNNILFRLNKENFSDKWLEILNSGAMTGVQISKEMLLKFGRSLMDSKNNLLKMFVGNKLVKIGEVEKGAWDELFTEADSVDSIKDLGAIVEAAGVFKPEWLGEMVNVEESDKQMPRWLKIVKKIKSIGPEDQSYIAAIETITILNETEGGLEQAIKACYEHGYYSPIGYLKTNIEVKEELKLDDAEEVEKIKTEGSELWEKYKSIDNNDKKRLVDLLTETNVWGNEENETLIQWQQEIAKEMLLSPNSVVEFKNKFALQQVIIGKPGNEVSISIEDLGDILKRIPSNEQLLGIENTLIAKVEEGRLNSSEQRLLLEYCRDDLLIQDKNKIRAIIAIMSLPIEDIESLARVDTLMVEQINRVLKHKNIKSNNDNRPYIINLERIQVSKFGFWERLLNN